MIWVPRSVGLCDESAKRLANDNGFLNAQRITKVFHIVAPLIQRPAVGQAIIAAPVPATVEVDDLGNIS